MIEIEDEIHHLEFSPDGNFLFFLEGLTNGFQWSKDV